MKSMTGYGRAEKIISDLDILVEIRSVNHRYFEFSSRIPKAYGYLEAPLKSLLKSEISRGKTEISVYIRRTVGKNLSVSINEQLAADYINALKAANKSLEMSDDLTLSSLLEFPDIFNIVEIKDNEQEIIDAVLETAGEALESFMIMKESEGRNLSSDILSKLDNIEDIIDKIDSISPSLTENYYNRLLARITELIGNAGIDEQRIITEAAVFGEKVSVDEETVRLGSHIAQARELAKQSEPSGKKLDFLVQEMNREANTIGSKAMDINITKLVVDLKSEIEKIREQIQNVE